MVITSNYSVPIFQNEQPFCNIYAKDFDPATPTTIDFTCCFDFGVPYEISFARFYSSTQCKSTRTDPF